VNEYDTSGIEDLVNQNYSAYENYLEVPMFIKQNVKDLAKQITAGYLTEYDKAKAIETYLKTHYTYITDNVTSPPPGKDMVEWFLFGSKSGKATQFATAFVILCRINNIPARYVVGFKDGEYDGDLNYSIRASNAHAWGEVYFNNYGWQIFDPCSSSASKEPPKYNVTVDLNESKIYNLTAIDRYTSFNITGTALVDISGSEVSTDGITVNVYARVNGNWYEVGDAKTDNLGNFNATCKLNKEIPTGVITAFAAYSPETERYNESPWDMVY